MCVSTDQQGHVMLTLPYNELILYIICRFHLPFLIFHQRTSIAIAMSDLQALSRTIRDLHHRQGRIIHEQNQASRARAQYRQQINKLKNIQAGLKDHKTSGQPLILFYPAHKLNFAPIPSPFDNFHCRHLKSKLSSQHPTRSTKASSRHHDVGESLSKRNHTALQLKPEPGSEQESDEGHPGEAGAFARGAPETKCCDGGTEQWS